VTYNTTKTAEGISIIGEGAFVQRFLTEGDECAVLLDSCAGDGVDFKEVVPSLTGKPITPVISHSDKDHTGEQEYFEAIAMHPVEYACYFARGSEGRAVESLWEVMLSTRAVYVWRWC
jgi:hypothetical protein